jgi:hypothetical protein
VKASPARICASGLPSSSARSGVGSGEVIQARLAAEMTKDAASAASAIGAVSNWTSTPPGGKRPAATS